MNFEKMPQPKKPEPPMELPPDSYQPDFGPDTERSPQTVWQAHPPAFEGAPQEEDLEVEDPSQPPDTQREPWKKPSELN